MSVLLLLFSKSAIRHGPEANSIYILHPESLTSEISGWGAGKRAAQERVAQLASGGGLTAGLAFLSFSAMSCTLLLKVSLEQIDVRVPQLRPEQLLPMHACDGGAHVGSLAGKLAISILYIEYAPGLP